MRIDAQRHQKTAAQFGRRGLGVKAVGQDFRPCRVVANLGAGPLLFLLQDGLKDGTLLDQEFLQRLGPHRGFGAHIGQRLQ